MTSLPLAQSLPSLPESDIIKVLDLLFEPSPPLHELTLPNLRTTVFPSYADLITAVHAVLAGLEASKSPEDITKLSEILCSHPRLGEKKVDSAQSRAEQAQLNQGGEDEALQLRELNQKYEETFPGLRYV